MTVWSIALRREASPEPEVHLLESSLVRGDIVITTGLVLQELLQCFNVQNRKTR